MLLQDVVTWTFGGIEPYVYHFSVSYTLYSYSILLMALCPGQPGRTSNRKQVTWTRHRCADAMLSTSLWWEPAAWWLQDSMAPAFNGKPGPRTMLGPPDSGWSFAIFLVLFGSSEANRGIHIDDASGCLHLHSLHHFLCQIPSCSYPPNLFWLGTGTQLCCMAHLLPWFSCTVE